MAPDPRGILTATHDPPAVSRRSGLPAAIVDAQELLAGADGRRRWRELAGLAVMAGVAGTGIQPPPLGLLEPVWSDPEARQRLLEETVPLLPWLAAAGVLLVALAAAARAFTLVLVYRVVRPSEAALPVRKLLGAGVLHFFWSSALTLPLYALLFAAEWRVAGSGYSRLLNAGDAELLPAALGVLFQFLLVLAPWVLLTLPAMVLLYELTPVSMGLTGLGPGRACVRVLALARERPRTAAGYLGVRLVLQLAGTTAVLLATVPSLAAAAVTGSPLLLAGWWLSRRTEGTAAALATTLPVLFCLAVAYVLVCAALVPVTVLLYRLAARWLSPDGATAP